MKKIQLLQIVKVINKILPQKPLTKNNTLKENYRVISPILNHEGKYIFFCPGCDKNHLIETKNWMNCGHKLSGPLDKPTVRGSVLYESNDARQWRCHSVITRGRIHFLEDSTHFLSGQTVELKPFEE